jgi:hypothetical protein
MSSMRAKAVPRPHAGSDKSRRHPGHHQVHDLRRRLDQSHPPVSGVHERLEDAAAVPSASTN